MELQDVEVLAEGLLFPEGPVAMADGSVLLVEIRRGHVTRVERDGTVSTVADVGGGPNGAAIGPDGAIYVCNNGGAQGEHPATPSIQRVDQDGSFEVLYTECAGRPLVSPNDLVFDRTGHFWFTDLGGNALFYASPDGGAIERALSGVVTPNGVGLSPDEDVLYWAETQTRQVHRRRLAGPGAIVESPGYGLRSMRTETLDEWTLLVGLPGAQFLDSLAVDGGGAVCIATLVDSGITVVSPADGSYEKFTLPAALADRSVTNICFGGSDLQTAYITLSSTGRLVSCRWPRPGLRLVYQEL